MNRLWDSLTQSEKAVALLIADGVKYLAIANRLELSPRTVQKRATSIKAKLGVTTANDIAAVVQGVR